MKTTTTTYNPSILNGLKLTIGDFTQLVKMRLTSLVVITAVGSYYLASGLSASLLSLVLLAIGGFGVTGASNALNQVLEKDYDSLMDRTKDRPLPSGRMVPSTAVLFAGFLCLLGITALSIFNSLAAFFGMMAFVLYAFVYTPLKRYSSAAVFVGAIAGAMPMLIGVVAFTGELTWLAILLFGIQFAWQYPHFWSIAFLGYGDYSNAGFKFVPSDKSGNIDIKIAYSSILYATVLLILSGFMYIWGYTGIVATLSMCFMSVVYLFYSIKFARDFDLQSAKQLMFSSLLYIPMVLIILLIDNSF